MDKPTEFDRAKADMCSSGPASSGDNLDGMWIDCTAYLGDPPGSGDEPIYWTDVEVRRTASSEWLITGSAKSRASDAHGIADALSHIWDTHLRYNYRSAHTVSLAPSHVLLRAVTQIEPGGIWVTASVRVGLS